MCAHMPCYVIYCNDEHTLHKDAMRETVVVPLLYRPGNEGFER